MSGNFPAVTAATAAVLGIMVVALALYIGAGRGKFATGMGDGGHEPLQRRIRMFGNLTEYAPIFLILLGLLDMSGTYRLVVQVTGPLFVICRFAHVYGLSMRFGPGPNTFRTIGAAGTALCIVALSLALGAVVLLRPV